MELFYASKSGYPLLYKMVWSFRHYFVDRISHEIGVNLI